MNYTNSPQVPTTAAPYLAKSPKNGQQPLSLLQHTLDVVAAGQAILDSLPLEQDEYSALSDDLVPTWLCHDWGKILTEFQKMLLVGGSVRNCYRHEIGSALLASSCLTLSTAQIFAVITHHKSACLFGHPPSSSNLDTKLLSADPSDSDDIWFDKRRGWLTDLKKQWTRFLDEIIRPLQRRYPSLPWKDAPQTPQDLTSLRDLKPYLSIQRANSPYPNNSQKMYWARLRGLMIAADHLGSAGHTEPLPVVSAPDLQTTLGATKTLYPYQEKILQHSDHLLLRAPTGAGKTEAIYCWLHAIWRPKQRTFYTLPYTASANAMHRRLSKAFGSTEAVGILHSKAASYLLSLAEAEPALDSTPSDNHSSTPPTNQLHARSTIHQEDATHTEGETAEESALRRQQAHEANERVQLAREIFFPVKVCTPHQILRYSLCGKGWEMGLLDLQHSAVIFDEFHAYDPKMTGFLIATARWLMECHQAKIAFLSATLPAFLQALLQEHLPALGTQSLVTLDPQSPRDAEILARKRHILTLHEGSILQTSAWNLIEQALSHQQRVLIVVNNVRTAQEIALRMRGFSPESTDWPISRPKNTLATHQDEDENAPQPHEADHSIPFQLPDGTEVHEICLLHSAFHAKDRRRIERAILSSSPPKVLIATQAIEVSLDIDYDIAFIENAPIDALIQRFGRVNRAGLRPPTSIHLFQQSVGRTPFYPKHCLDRTWQTLQSLAGQPLREADLIEACDKVYQDGYQGDEKKVFEDALSIPAIRAFQEEAYPALQNHRWIDEIIEPSSFDILPGSAVSLCERYEDLVTQRRWIEARELLVPVSYSLFRAAGASIAKHERTEVLIHHALDYRSDLGAFLPPREAFDDRSF